MEAGVQERTDGSFLTPLISPSEEPAKKGEVGSRDG